MQINTFYKYEIRIQRVENIENLNSTSDKKVINFIVYSKCKINLTKEKEHIKAKIPPGVSYMANLCSPKD